ncbi:hypothetical protein GIB67_026570 [Kingdonia uniflora]|uniref:Uncharacterized protein n=1 Tax=Kingdonia uniflora TaxID=39325 RepID=A0A7J7NNX7_9MAGN|nr:hypothetical protein GIB67_026570 [Kingdonia uniflora]
MALFHTPSSPSLSMIRRLSVVTRCVSPIGFQNRSISLGFQRLKKRSFVSLAASHEDSHSEVEAEKRKNELNMGSQESEDAWRQMLETFKEQTEKMQGMSKESYELYSKKAMAILKETSERLKIQAEKTTQDLSVIAREASEEGKEYFSIAAENSPEELKDIVETFASPPDDLKQVSKVRDFYLGIPYGILLSLMGFLSFMLTGSTAGIRFGIILGGTLLALSISSLRSWRKGESDDLALKGQADASSDRCHSQLIWEESVSMDPQIHNEKSPTTAVSVSRAIKNLPVGPPLDAFTRLGQHRFGAKASALEFQF